MAVAAASSPAAGMTIGSETGASREVTTVKTGQFSRRCPLERPPHGPCGVRLARVLAHGESCLRGVPRCHAPSATEPPFRRSVATCHERHAWDAPRSKTPTSAPQRSAWRTPCRAPPCKQSRRSAASAAPAPPTSSPAWPPRRSRGAEAASTSRTSGRCEVQLCLRVTHRPTRPPRNLRFRLGGSDRPTRPVRRARVRGRRPTDPPRLRRGENSERFMSDSTFLRVFERLRGISLLHRSFSPLDTRMCDLE